MNYMSMVLDDPVNAPSPRYWLVWPGTMLLLAGSFAEVFANYKSIFASFAQLFEPLISKFRKGGPRYNKDDLIEEPCPEHELVPLWMWGGGIVLSIIFTCIIMALQFKLSVGQTILAILFGKSYHCPREEAIQADFLKAFIFSFIGAESCGRTNIIPGLSDPYHPLECRTRADL